MTNAQAIRDDRQTVAASGTPLLATAWGDLVPFRLLGAVCVLVIVTLVAGCGPGSGGTANPSATVTSGPTRETPQGKPLQYVAFGDSWPEGAHCGGCKTFAHLWADLIKEQTARPVQITSFMGAAEHSDAEGKTSASLLSSLQADKATRDAVRTADVILIATGPNALEGILPKITAGRCGGPDGFECIRALGKVWTKDFNAILEEIAKLRDGHPTVVRLVNAANAFAIDKELAAAAPKGFPSTGGDLIFKLLTQAQCSAAQAHGAVCVDVRPLITGPGGDSDENSDASMRAVAQALMATGLRQLNATS